MPVSVDDWAATPRPSNEWPHTPTTPVENPRTPAASVEARIEGRRVSLEAPFWYPIGPVAGRREKVPIPLCPALRGNAFADELHCHLRSELIGVCPVAILVREHADVRERLNSAPLHSTL